MDAWLIIGLFLTAGFVLAVIWDDLKSLFSRFTVSRKK